MKIHWRPYMVFEILHLRTLDILHQWRAQEICLGDFNVKVGKKGEGGEF